MWELFLIIAWGRHLCNIFSIMFLLPMIFVYIIIEHRRHMIISLSKKNHDETPSKFL